MDNMPQWLKEKDEYKPESKKDAFIDKSILSIFNMIAKIRRGTSLRKNSIGCNPVLKLMLVLITILLVSISLRVEFVATVDVVLFLIISSLRVEKIKQILRVVFIAATFTAIILIPSIASGNVYNSVNIVIKVTASVATVNLLSVTTNWNDITGALRILRIPDIFIFVLDTTIKYIGVLGELGLNMLQALKKRTVGVNTSKGSYLSAIMGVMFIKSKEMAEDMQGAMECRGFNGEYRKYVQAKSLGLGDYAIILSGVFVLILYFYFGR